MVRKRIRTREDADGIVAPRSSSPPDATLHDKGAGTDGFSLSFVGGRGILSLKNISLGNTVEMELLELIIAELTFPFDVTGGIRGLRHRRHRLGRLRLSLALQGVSDLVAKSLGASTWSDTPTISFETDHIAVLLSYGPEKGRVPVSFRLVPRASENSFNLFIDESRAYGPLPVSPLLVAVASIQKIEEIQAKGLSVNFPEPLHLALFHTLPARGWRIPDYSRARLSRFELMPDRLVLEFRDVDLLDDAAANPFGQNDEEQLRYLKKTEEYRTVAEADALLAAGELAAARSAYGSLLTRDPENPVIIGRLSSIDLTTPELLPTAYSQIEGARQQYPKRTDLAALQCHGAALQKNVEAEIDACRVLLAQSNSLERYAIGMRMGEILLETDPRGASEAFKKALAARREDRTAITKLLKAYIKLNSRNAALQLVPRFIAAHKHASERTDAYVQAGRILLDKLAEPSEAARHFERAFMSDPQNIEAGWGLAESLAQSGQVQRAVSQFERLERLCRREGDMKRAGKALAEIGNIWLQRQEPTLAIQRLREALDFDKEAADTRILLARALSSIKRMADAAGEYETALKHAGEGRKSLWFGEAALALAKIYFEHLDDPEGAEIWANAAAEFPALEAESGQLLVAIWETQGKHHSLLSHLQAKAKSTPSLNNILKLAALLREQGDLEQYCDVLEKALSDFPEEPEILDGLIEASRQLGRHERLRELLVTRAHTLAGGNQKKDIAIELGNLELRQFADPSASLKWFKLAASLDSESAEAKQGIALAVQSIGNSAKGLLEAGQYERARELFSAARREASGVDEQELAIGEAQSSLKLGDLEGALRAAMTALESPGKHRGKAAKLAARAFMELDAPDEAVRHLIAAAEQVDPQDSASLYWAAGQICQQNLGDAAQALSLFERVVAIDPSHREAERKLQELMIEQNDCEGLAELIIANSTPRDEAPRMQQAAQLFFAAGKPARAAEVLEQLHKKSGDIEDARALARALKETGRINALLALVREQTERDGEIDPQLLDELEIAADLLESRSEVEAAAAVVAELARLSDPDGTRAARAARLALSIGQIKSARHLLHLATEKQPRPEWILRLARLLHPISDYRELAELKQLLEERTEPVSLEYRLGFLEISVDHDLAANREDDAVVHLSEMIALEPTNPAIWQRLVSVLERRGKWEKLAEEMDHRLELLSDPADIAELTFEKGQLLETKLGDESSGQKCYDRVLELCPGHDGALRASCHLAFQTQKWERLDQLLSQVDVEEHDPALELWRANAAERMGRKQEAASLYKLLVNRDPENTMATEGLARVEPDTSPDTSLEGKLSNAFERLRQK